ncbi:MAG: ATP-binding cassette domain-containing protein [Thermoplasmata archaeon]
MIDVRSLTVFYDEKKGIEDVSLTIKEGEIVLVFGPSGCGKSTLMNALCGFIPYIIPARINGEIYIESKKFETPVEVARIVGMVQQEADSQFCTETVEEEIAFGPENFNFDRKEIENTIKESLNAVNAKHLRKRKLSELSGGEKQKVAIASMLALRPKVLILDEPTASLDQSAIKEVLDTIRNLRENRKITLIIVEHRIERFFDVAERFILMENGKIVLDCKKGSVEYKKLRDDKKEGFRIKEDRKCGDRNVISVRNLTFRYGDRKVLDDVNLDIKEGSIVGLLGNNGTGKTTFLRLLCGLEKIQEGSITIFGNRYDKNNLAKPWIIARSLGLVFQNPSEQIFENSIEREILFGARNFGLDISHAMKMVEDYENKEGVRRDRHPNRLSFGQKRRLNISSVYSYQPRVLLLDEPFAGQDSKNVSLICDDLERLNKECVTILIVTHEPLFARTFCTHVYTFKDGKIMEGCEDET